MPTIGGPTEEKDCLDRFSSPMIHGSLCTIAYRIFAHQSLNGLWGLLAGPRSSDAYGPTRKWSQGCDGLGDSRAGSCSNIDG